jgi:pyruvate,water dikinase
MLMVDVGTFKTLDTLDAADQARVGGKAYNCARLRQAGFPVPDALIVPSDATESQIQALRHDQWLDAAPAGTRYAVRSSGLGEDSTGHSFAGIHETQLNVERDQIVEAVIVCRRSAASDQARAYRRARGIGEDEAGIGVLVQRMVSAAVSGVAFTTNPITGAAEIVINAAPGLGEALVSGLVTPDEYRLNKSDLAVIDATTVSNTLDGAKLAELGDMIRRIEQHYGAPQDIEWCHDGTGFWIVQSRPITTTKIDPIEWTRANLAEVLPDQLSPQALDVYEPLLNTAERTFFGRLMAPQSERGPIVKSFHGRLYFNLWQLRHVTSIVRAPFAETLRSLGHSERIKPEDEIATPAPLPVILRALPDLLRLGLYTARMGAIFRDHRAKTEEWVARLDAEDPRTLSDARIFETVEWWLGIMPKTLTAVFTMSSVQFREETLRNACRRVGMAYDDFVLPQLAVGERSVSTQQAVDLVALANGARTEAAAVAYLSNTDASFADYRTALAGTAFLARFDGFLERYGHRGRYESDWALPRLHEDPTPALFAIRGLLQGPPEDLDEAAARQQAKADAAMRAFEGRLTPWQRFTMLRRVKSTLRGLKLQYVRREHVRSDLTRVVSRMRAWHLVLADRFVERGWIDRRDDYFLLHFDEVKRACADPAIGPALRQIAADRAAQLAAERDLEMPLFMHESELPALLQRRPQTAAADGDALTGLCVSGGSVEAEVVVMRDPSEFAAMKRGAILVTRATDPSWTPLFTLASGVIVEVGGMLSHASTIAREYGLPALANVKDATRRLKTGDRVKLDASGGRVDVLKETQRSASL